MGSRQALAHPRGVRLSDRSCVGAQLTTEKLASDSYSIAERRLGCVCAKGGAISTETARAPPPAAERAHCPHAADAAANGTHRAAASSVLRDGSAGRRRRARGSCCRGRGSRRAPVHAHGRSARARALWRDRGIVLAPTLREEMQRSIRRHSTIKKFQSARAARASPGFRARARSSAQVGARVRVRGEWWPRARAVHRSGRLGAQSLGRERGQVSRRRGQPTTTARMPEAPRHPPGRRHITRSSDLPQYGEQNAPGEGCGRNPFRPAHIHGRVALPISTRAASCASPSSPMLTPVGASPSRPPTLPPPPRSAYTVTKKTAAACQNESTNMSTKSLCE